MSLRVSIHGGHSGQFCTHARDTLERIVVAYADAGFAWVGLTEHMPAASEQFLYPEEKAAGLTVASMDERFALYMAEARRLQRKYSDRIEILVAFETEAYSGAPELALALRERFTPDYVLGSVHHVADRAIDYSAEEFRRVAACVGGMEQLYCRYFDQQYDLIQRIRPEVIGHFDLIRLFDPDYPRHLNLPTVQQRIRRNLEVIRDLGLILDFNVAALKKGATEPYISRPILEMAHDLGIAVVPGDDAHSVDTVGLHLDRGVALLQEVGITVEWRKPAAQRRKPAAQRL